MATPVFFAASCIGSVFTLTAGCFAWGGSSIFLIDLAHMTAGVTSIGIDPRKPLWQWLVRGRHSMDAGAWVARFTTNATEVSGNPISPNGHAQLLPITLPQPDWRLVLGPDDWILSMHIPSGGGLTPQTFVASMRLAVEFFLAHFPQTPPVSIICKSWTFSPMLERILPPQTNLVRNLREVYLWPAPVIGPYDGLWSLFCPADGVIRPESITPHTRLERAVHDYLQAGQSWRAGAMFFLVEDLQRFGEQPYRASINLRL
jgi:hypothetical protein